jgi:GTPase Era involved in 16S rRNA processing
MEYRRMKTPYTATAKRNPGRKSYIITFRHPLKMENGRPGKKVFKGLGTDVEETAKSLEGQMNALLARDDLHSVDSRAAALRDFDEIIVDIFYGDLDPSPTNHRLIRDRLLPLPSLEPGQAVRTLILGNSGVGKTTLLRRLIGSDAERDRFPATSTNRTTTCEIEVITGQTDYSAAVTFLTRHQTQQEVGEALSNAVLKAIEGGNDEIVMKEVLDDPDQRFRLKYVLGGWNAPNPKAGGSLSFKSSSQGVATTTAVENSSLLTEILQTIRSIAANAQAEVEPILGELDSLKDEERNYALDEMQRAGESSDSFQEVVSQIMEEIEVRFEELSEGQFKKSSTGWPEAWTCYLRKEERDAFLKAIRWFCSNAKPEWGHLLTPLVSGIRVSGSFKPEWIPEEANYDHVFVDTQGLDHEKPTTELSTETTSLFGQVQNILFIESGKDSLKSQSARKVMEAIAGAGYSTNLTVVLTHMDLVVGDDIPTEEDRKAKAFSGLRSLVENEVSRNVSRESSRKLAAHLDRSTFYLGFLDPKKYPEDWDSEDRIAFEESLGDELLQLTEHLTVRANPQLLQPSVPEYSFESLALAVREASAAFQEIWDARLGYKLVEGITSAPWQSVKAMSRRYAEGWFDGYWLRPIDTLVSLTRNVLTRFLETPLRWLPEQKKITSEEQAAIIDRVKQIVNDELTELSKTRLWKQPQTRWQAAYEPSGTGSTFLRRQRVHELLEHQVPIPESISDRWAQAWVEEIKAMLIGALKKLQEEYERDKVT